MKENKTILKKSIKGSIVLINLEVIGFNEFALLFILILKEVTAYIWIWINDSSGKLH